MKAGDLVKRSFEYYGDIPELAHVGLITGIEGVIIPAGYHIIVMWHDGLSWDCPESLVVVK